MRYGAHISSIGDYSDAALLAELAHEAEESGWDGVFIWDHVGRPHAVADPWVALAAMAMRTKRVKLGPMITPVPRRRPWKLARETITLDHLSKGRLILGVGLGWENEEFDTFGEEANPKIRAEKLDEGLEVLAGLWSGETFNYSGKHYQVKDAYFQPRPVQTPRIPIWACGAWSDKKAPFRRGARWDGMVAVNGNGENRPLFPAEIRDIRAYMEKHRTNSDPFDVVVIQNSKGDGSAAERQQIAELEQAGVTWWLEFLNIDQFPTVQELRERLHKGPPGR